MTLQQHICKLIQQLMAHVLALGILFQNCNTSPVAPRRTQQQTATTNQQSDTVQQTIAIVANLSVKDTDANSRVNPVQTVSIFNMENTPSVNHAAPLTTLSPNVENRLTNNISQQPDTNKKTIEAADLTDRSSAKPDKGKEKLVEEQTTSEEELTLPINGDAKSCTISTASQSQLSFSSTYKADISDLRNYFKILFERINSLNAYHQFQSNIYKIIDKNYYEEYKSGCVLAIWENLYPYIEAILYADYFDNLPQEEQLKLVNSFYELNFKIARYYLNEIPKSFHTGELNITDLQQRYQAARNKLRTSFGIPKKLLKRNYLQMLNELYESVISIRPEISKLCNIQAVQKRTHQHKSNISPRRIKAEQRSQAAHGLNFLRANKSTILEEDPSSIQLYTAIVEFCEQISKEDDSCLQHIGEDLERWKKYAEKFLEMERLAFINSSAQTDNFVLPRELNQEHFIKLMERLTFINSSAQTDNFALPRELNQEHLIKLYESLYETISQFNIVIYQFLKAGILTLIMAKQSDRALVRLEAAEAFYASKEQPYDFETFQASMYALCGKYERLTALNDSFIKKQLENRRKLQTTQAQQHRKKIARIKEVQSLQSNLEITPLTASKASKKQQLHSLKSLEPIQISDLAYQQQATLQQQEVEARLLRHQEAENKRTQRQLIGQQDVQQESSTTNSNEPTVSTHDPSYTDSNTSIIHFFLPKRPFKTVSNIFNGNWKIKRIDIENLFDVLGQHVNIATKSSHHIISIPQGIALIKEEQIVGLITNLSAGMSGHISLPNWEKEVPFYIRPQIQKMLTLIGINKENYLKGNREDFMQFMPIKKSIK
jgi:hypothetical protein